MRRTELQQEIRKMQFEAFVRKIAEKRLNQESALKLLEGYNRKRKQSKDRESLGLQRPAGTCPLIPFVIDFNIIIPCHKSLSWSIGQQIFVSALPQNFALTIS